MSTNSPNPYSSWANRKAKQDFKRRYNQMSDVERAKFDKDVDHTGCVIGAMIFLVFILIVILKALFS